MRHQRIAALFVEEDGPYSKVENCDIWGVTKDARKYPGPHPAILHPPCERWGRYATGGPNPNARRFEVGDDGGCFESALKSLSLYGGVLEHPAHSKAWKHFDLCPPAHDGYWSTFDDGYYSCHVEQGHYGHPARKATWLLTYGVDRALLPELIWGPCDAKARLDMGPHSKEETKRWRAEGRGTLKRLSTRERVWTPEPFRDVLVSIARSVG